MRTWLTERFGLSVPVVAAPMAGVSGGELAAAVSAAGALGMVGIGSEADPRWVREQRRAAATAGGPYGAGLLAWSLPDRPQLLDAVVGEDDDRPVPLPALVSVSFGDYAAYVPRLQEAGIVVATQAGTVADALAAEDAGVDVVVARGGEGGGHGRDLVATLPLLQAVLERVRLPVLAAGGVGTPRGLAAVLAAGAAGAWVGTAFLTCREALTVDRVAAHLADVDETGTAYGTVFDTASAAGWPAEYGGRAVRNEFFDTWHGRENELAADREALHRYRSARDTADLGAMAVYAGQGVGLLGAERRPAAEVVAELAAAGVLLRDAADRLA
ncbi:MAG: nitronate monooxygenase [Actinomycetota bacterium]|nr:nitronate monooxygenase [Actinomycetota bacterium]